MRFSQISQIDLSRQETWENTLFLTFDLDWASDEVLARTIDHVEAADVDATWFVTHETPLLERLRANPKFELGIHPNFNPLLLQGDTTRGKDAQEVLANILKIV